MPGKESLRLQQYYGHTRNAFWKIIYELFDGNLELNYTSRIEFLKQNNIALWDICQYAERKSSLDADIKNEIPNEISNLINTFPSIKTIAFNGKKTQQLFDKYVERNSKIRYITLLSTSPANARFTFEEKLENWKSILQ